MLVLSGRTCLRALVYPDTMKDVHLEMEEIVPRGGLRSWDFEAILLKEVLSYFVFLK